MFGLKIFVWVQTFRRRPFAASRNFYHPAFKSPCFISSNIEFQPDRVFLFKGCLRIHYRLVAWLGGETFAFCSWHWNIGEILGATSYTENTTNHIVIEFCFDFKGLREPCFGIALRVFLGAKSVHCHFSRTSWSCQICRQLVKVIQAVDNSLF